MACALRQERSGKRGMAFSSHICAFPVESLRGFHSPSPKRLAINASSASIACCSSGPSISMVTVEPIPAASIITPMMLLASTWRPLRDILTWLTKLPASWVSLAEARACSPSLLMMVVSLCSIFVGMVGGLVLYGCCAYLQHALRAAGQRIGDQLVELFAAIADRAHQHRQVDPGQHPDAARLGQARGDVGRRGAEDVSQHQRAVVFADGRQP